MVGQQDRLGPLQVGVPGQVGILRLPGPVEQHLLEGDHLAGQCFEFALGVEPEVGGDLVVAAPAGVQFGADVPGQLGHPSFDRGVDVLVVGGEVEGAGGQLLLHLVEGGEQRLGLDRGEQPDPPEPAHMGARTGEVVAASVRS